ncbi:MAG: isopeptide-forming domain-containing fimbrial protein [Holdemanella biformis]|nr:isopeptide-forming domain-containing fimbrial protein [Holdemanella biformis]
MKLIKKIAAIMFAFMMVFSLSTNAKADGAVNTSQGSIKIDNVKANETYKIYRILDLDSYKYSEGDPLNGNYSYTYKTETEKNATEWKSFIEQNTGEGKYFKLTDEKYITANDGVNGEDIAKAALQYVQTHTTIEADAFYTATADGTYTFDHLPLGYYLVESTVGALCNLNTTNPSKTISIKYTAPIVAKKIMDHDTNKLVNLKTVNIEDSVTYEVTITVGNGAKSYFFHDKIDAGLKYFESNLAPGKPQVHVSTNHDKNNGTGKPNYLNPDPNTEIKLNYDDDKKNSFTLKFEDSFIQKLDVGDVITLMYSATVTEDAPMDKAIKNTAYLNYGNKQESNKENTRVFTYAVPVWKYTIKGDNNRVGLPGAKFKLYKNEECTEIVPLKQENTTNKYIYTPNNVDYSLTSDTKGNLVIEGLAADQYYLKEIEAPNGYNKLTKPIKIIISHTDGNKQIQVEGTKGNVTQVDVLNNTGSLLPTTGGMGTTLIYLVGGALVLGSGFVLANKKRAKAK